MPIPPPTVHPAHFDVLAAFAARDLGRLNRLLSGGVFDDGDQLWQFLNAHRLWELGSDLATGGNLSHCWSERLASQLATRLDKNRGRQRRLRESLAEIQDELVHAGLEFILLKGLIYGGLYYPSPDYRHQYDLDLLVKDEALEPAMRCLAHFGFQQKRGRTGLRRSQRRTEHAVSLHRNDVGVDLHWRLRNLPAYNLDYRRIWEESRHVAVGNGSYRTLSVADTLAGQLVSVFHDIGRGGFAQKALLDLFLAMRAEYRHIDWSSFRQDRLSENTWRPSANVLAILLRAFRCGAEFPRVAALVDAEPELIAADDDEQVWRLLEQPRGSLASYLWTCRVYPVSWLRDARWLLQRNLTHAGRIPLVTTRSARFLWNAARWALSSSPTVQRRHSQPQVVQPAVDAVGRAPVHDIQFRYGGMRIAVSSSSEPSIAWLQEFLHPQFEIVEPGLDDCSIELIVDPQYHALLEQLCTATAQRQVSCFTLDGSFAPGVAFGESPAGRWIFDPKRNTFYHVNSAANAIRIVARDDAKHSRMGLMRVVREVATVGQLRRGRLAVHGAAFVAGDRSILMTGPKRSGKTTLLMWALAQGLPFLANDRLHIDVSAKEPRVQGMPTIVRIRPSSLQFFPQVRATLDASRFLWHRTVNDCIVRSYPGSGVQQVGDSLPGLSGRQFCDVLRTNVIGSATLGSILFPVVDPQVSGIRLQRLSPSNAAERLARGLLKPGHRQQVSEVFGGEAAGATVSPENESRQCRELTDRVPCFECVLGTNAYHAAIPAEWRGERCAPPVGKAA